MNIKTAKQQGLEVVFNKDHELHERIFYDSKEKSFYDSYTDLFVTVDDIPVDTLVKSYLKLYPAIRKQQTLNDVIGHYKSLLKASYHLLKGVPDDLANQIGGPTSWIQTRERLLELIDETNKEK